MHESTQRRLFFEEANNLLHTIDRAIQTIKCNPSDKTAVEIIFRSIHGLKAMVLMLGATDLAEEANTLEDVLFKAIALDESQLASLLLFTSKVHRLFGPQVMIKNSPSHTSLAPIFCMLEEVAKETSQFLGKKVKLIFSGEETIVPEQLSSGLISPLVQIIKNAVDHGIKESGFIHVKAHENQDSFVIEISDEGQGIDAGKITALARARGIITEETCLRHNEALELIFHHHLTTKMKASQISGRGLGMSIVKSRIEELGGWVKVRSKIGVGTSFEVTLPRLLRDPGAA